MMADTTQKRVNRHTMAAKLEKLLRSTCRVGRGQGGAQADDGRHDPEEGEQAHNSGKAGEAAEEHLQGGGGAGGQGRGQGLWRGQGQGLLRGQGQGCIDSGL